MHDLPHERHPRTQEPLGNYINAQMWFSRNANTGGPGHTRITQHMREAESIFLSAKELLRLEMFGHTTQMDQIRMQRL